MILGHSRMRYAVFTLSTDTCTLIQCHLNAFEYFGGYTSEILYGNIKTVILKRALRAGGHQWNPKFEDFFSHHGFIPRLCRPCCPRTKGKMKIPSATLNECCLLRASGSGEDASGSRSRGGEAGIPGLLCECIQSH